MKSVEKVAFLVIDNILDVYKNITICFISPLKRESFLEYIVTAITFGIYCKYPLRKHAKLFSSS